LRAQPKPAGRWWLWPFGLAVLAVLVLLLVRWLVQPERLGAFVLQRAEAASGLRLRVEGPPRLGIWPRLHLQLQQLQVSDPQHPDRLLASAEQVALYLPLSALRGEQRIDAIELQSPRLFLDALSARSRQQMGPPAAPWLPKIAALQIEDGQLQAGDWSLQAIELELTQLMHVGQVAQLLGSGVLVSGAQRLPLAIAVRASNPGTAELRFALQSLQLGDQQSQFLQATGGQLTVPDWNSPRLALRGSLATWPQAWPALADAWQTLLAGLQFELRFQPGAPAADLQISASAEGRTARLELPLAALADWLAAGDWLSPPPGHASLDIDRVQFDAIEIEGLQLRHGDHAAH
jgi:hypothetical protein